MTEKAMQQECPIYLLKKRLWDTHDVFELCDLFECEVRVIDPEDFEFMSEDMISMTDNVDIPF